MEQEYNMKTAGYYPDPPRGPQAQVDRNPVDAVEWASGLTADLCYRVEAVVSRLCGIQPTGTGNSGGDKATSPNGIFPSLQSKAETTAELVQWAMRELDRLERQLS